MAEENEKPEGTPSEPENTGDADSQPDGTPQKPDAETVDYEKRYKDLQAEQTRTSQENAELNRRLEQLEQAGQETPEADDLDDEEGFTDRKTVSQMIALAVSQAVAKVRTQAADTYFRRTYPDLVKYENAIAGIMRSQKEAPKKGASAEDRIDAAVKEFNDLTEEAKTTATAEAEAKAKAREEQNRKASGLTSSSTTPAKSGEEELSDEDELKARKRRQAKKRGLV